MTTGSSPPGGTPWFRLRRFGRSSAGCWRPASGPRSSRSRGATGRAPSPPRSYSPYSTARSSWARQRTSTRSGSSTAGGRSWARTAIGISSRPSVGSCSSAPSCVMTWPPAISRSRSGCGAGRRSRSGAATPSGPWSSRWISIELVLFSSVTRADVRRSGEQDRDELRRRAAHAGPIDDDTLVYRVEFHVVS
jgi:hypothetical protein